jgi:hypothetical protein
MDTLYKLCVSVMCDNPLSRGGMAELECVGIHNCGRKSVTVSMLGDGIEQVLTYL